MHVRSTKPAVYCRILAAGRFVALASLAAGLPAPDHEVHADVGAGRDLPASFIASARKPG